LNSFLKIKNSNPPPRAARVDRESVQWLAAAVRSTSASNRAGDAIIFRCPRTPGGASQSSARSCGRPRGSVAQIFANFRKLFLVSWAAEKLPRNSPRGGG
jgi:hypothetical protein